MQLFFQSSDIKIRKHNEKNEKKLLLDSEKTKEKIGNE
jgi:hypothetical protein